MQDYEAGRYFVDVFVTDKGFASVTPSLLVPGPIRNATQTSASMETGHAPYPSFLLRPHVVGVVPERGSVAGGTVVTISGSGFSPTHERMNVLLGDRVCEITGSTYSVIMCVSSESVSVSGGGVSVEVMVNSIAADSDVVYTYDPVATPTVTAIVPETGAGDVEIEITGENFGSDESAVGVQILSGVGAWRYGHVTSPCSVSSVTPSAITCRLPSIPAGEYRVVVHVSSLGLARETSLSSSSVRYDLLINSFTPTASGNGGGIEITITGAGFPSSSSSSSLDDAVEGAEGDNATSLSISFCSTACLVSTSSSSSLTCLLDAPAPVDMSTTCDTATINYGGLTSSLSSLFVFQDALTPKLISVIPLQGGTAGGTIVTITGTNFFPQGVMHSATLAEDDLVVSIDGAICVWYGRTPVPTETSLECRTSEHRTTLHAEVKVFVRTSGFAIRDGAPSNPATSEPFTFEYIDRWSSPYTWGGADPPREGESVVIHAGQTVVLDIDTPVLNLVLVEGELVFEDTRDLHLQAKYIFINTGRLQVSWVAGSGRR